MERTHKRLFSIDGMNLEFAERIENAGDIGRELAKLDGGSGWTDHYYIGEKVRKLGRVIDDDGSQFYLKDFLELPATDDLKQLEQEIVQTYKDQYNAYEGELGTLGALSKQLSFAVLDRDVPAMRDAWVDFVVEWNKLRDEHGFSPFPMNLYSPSLQAEVLKASLRDTEAEYDLSGLPALLQDASEYDQVVHRYRGTDAWMKAPNGEDSNLDERQWVLVRTPAFKKWFGDWEADPANASKVLDANGEPKVVYHYTSERFNAFDVSKARRSMDIPGFYFSDEKTNWKDMGENLIPAFLNLRNPINGKPSARSYGMETREALVSEGYDGAVTIDEDLEETEYLAFYPTQIKSADRNIGTFSPETSNILYQEAERKVPLESRVSGDDFLNAKDTIEIIREVGGDVDDNGYASVYHATSRENAKAIESSKLMYAYEDSSFFSTRPDGWIKGYGSSVLRFEIPVERLILDDLFVDEAHFRVRLSRSKTMDVERFDPVILYQAMRTIPYDELHEQEIPKNTRKAFKLMRIFPTQPNMLFPLFAKPEEGRQAFLMGKWFRAENQRPAIGGKQLAQRPGIHALGLPVFNQGKVRRKGESRVWVEVNIPEINPETQAEADSSPVESNGQLQGIRDRILQPDEAYDYKTNPSARDAGSWPIVGSMQPVRIIPDSEIEQILRENGLDRYVEDSLAGVDEALAERMTRDMTSYGESYSDGPAILYQPAPKVGDRRLRS
jgi:hypothetical protein